EIQLGRIDEAREALSESLAIARRLGYREVIAYCLGGFAELAMVGEDPERTATLFGASEGLFAEIGAIPNPDEAEVQQRLTEYIVGLLGAARADELRAEGAALTLDELLEDVASRT